MRQAPVVIGVVTLLAGLTLPALSEAQSGKVLGAWLPHKDGKLGSDKVEFFKDQTCSVEERGTRLACRWVALDDGRIKVEVTALGTTMTLFGIVKGDEMVLDGGKSKDPYLREGSATVKQMAAREKSSEGLFRKVANDFRVVPTYVYAYEDRFKAIPGDDPNAGQRFGSGAAATTPLGKQGNGKIDGVWNSRTATDESSKFWDQVVAAKILVGGKPKNALGGELGINGNTEVAQIRNMSGMYQICSSRIPAEVAKRLDKAMDDGSTTSGSMQSVKDGAPMRSTSVRVGDEGLYTVCMTL